MLKLFVLHSFSKDTFLLKNVFFDFINFSLILNYIGLIFLKILTVQISIFINMMILNHFF